MVRLIINVNDTTADALKSLATKKKTSVTEVVRRSVSVYKFMDDALKRGEKIQIKSGDRVTDVGLP